MSFTIRIGWWLMALSLSFNGHIFALIQSASAAPTVQQSTDETALRALAETFYKTWAAKDLDGYLRLWSARSPELEARKKAATELFAGSEKIEVKSLAARQIKLDGEKARVRVEAETQVIEAKTGKEKAGYGKRPRTLECVKEEGRWKVWRETSTFAELAAALAATGSEQERAALLAAEKDWVTAGLVEALNNQGRRSVNQGDYPQALAIFDLAQRLGAQIGDQAGLSEALMGNGFVLWLQGDYAQALEPFHKCLAMREAQGDKVGVSRVLNNIGNVYRSQGDYALALEHYEKSLAIVEALGDKREIAPRLGNIGVVYSRQGNLARALDYYQRSLALDEAEGDKLGTAINLGNIGALHRKQGNYALALNHYQKSLALSEAIGDKVGIAQMLSNMGNVYRHQGNYAQALERYRKSLALNESLGNKGGIAGVLSAIGLVHDAQGSHAQAAEYHQKSLSINEAGGDKDGAAIGLANLAANHNKQGRHAQALDFAERAAPLARQMGSLEILWVARASAGLAHRALNQPDRARQAFEEAVAVIETMRAQVAGSEQEQQSFFASRVAPHHALVDLLARERRPVEALAFAERAKARALLDVLQTGRINITKALTREEQEQERKLRAELVALNAQAAHAGRRDNPDQAKLAELKSQLEKARLNYEAFQTALYAAHPELRARRGEAPIIKAEELAALLPSANSALLEYVVTDEATYLFVVTKTTGKLAADAQVYALPVKREELSRQTEALRRQLAGRDLGFRAAARQLYQLLLKPARAQLAGKTNLVIVPDDKLWELPFQALLGEGDRYLVETSAVSYAPSLTVLREMKTPRGQRQAQAASATLLALGNPALGRETIERATLALRDGKLDPLPEAEAEVKALGQLYGATRSKIYVGAEAREDRAKSESAQAGILHFATHGILNDAAPMYSHLALAPGDKNEDGLLEAWELMQLDLKAELAVLSACETARGRFGAGEGVIGLTWALFVAGVPTTVVSQWKVESASARELMLNFHRQLSRPAATAQARVAKAQALRQAALTLMKKPETSHPFYWAGFVLVGDGR